MPDAQRSGPALLLTALSSGAALAGAVIALQAVGILVEDVGMPLPRRHVGRFLIAVLSPYAILVLVCLYVRTCRAAAAVACATTLVVSGFGAMMFLGTVLAAAPVPGSLRYVWVPFVQWLGCALGGGLAVYLRFDAKRRQAERRDVLFFAEKLRAMGDRPSEGPAGGGDSRGR